MACSIYFIVVDPQRFPETGAARNCTADERLPFTRGPGMPGPYRAS